MPSSTFHLRPATEGDAIIMTCLGYDAFTDGGTTWNDAIFPPGKQTARSPVKIFKWHTEICRAGLERRIAPNCTTVVVVRRTGGPDGAEEIVSVAIWQYPSIGLDIDPEEMRKTKKELTGAAPSCMDPRALDEFGEFETKAKRALRGPDKRAQTWDLEIIAVKPDYQRLGVGTMLVRWGTERAAAAGHDVIHLASHSSKKLCETLGFEDSMTVSLEFHGDMYYPMKKLAS